MENHIFNDIINDIYNNLFAHYNRLETRITDCNYIIKHLSRDNYLKKYFPSDYFFWDMYIDIVTSMINKGKEYYDKRQFDIIIFELRKILEKETPYYMQVKNVVENSYNDYFYAIDSVINRIDTPEKYKGNKKKFRHDFMTLQDIIDAMNMWNDDESHYVLDKIEIFIKEYKSLSL